MTINQVVGTIVIVVAYGCTWYLLLKSTKVVNIIDREGLKHTRVIKRRLKRKKEGGKTQ